MYGNITTLFRRRTIPSLSSLCWLSNVAAIVGLSRSKL